MRRLALVDEKGNLKDTISASDIIHISPSGEFSDQFLKPLDEFMEWLRMSVVRGAAVVVMGISGLIAFIVAYSASTERSAVGKD